MEASNLQRHYFIRTMTSGILRQRWLLTVCPSSIPTPWIVPLVARLTRDNSKDALEGYEIVLDGTDNSRYLINDACVLFNKILVYGAIHQFEGQVSVFNLEDVDLSLSFSEPPPVGTVPLRGDRGGRRAPRDYRVHAGPGGDQGDNRNGGLLSGKLLLYDAMSNTTRHEAFPSPKAGK